MILQTDILDWPKHKLEIGLKEAIQAVFGSLDNEHESLNQVIDELLR